MRQGQIDSTKVQDRDGDSRFTASAIALRRAGSYLTRTTQSEGWREGCELHTRAQCAQSERLRTRASTELCPLYPRAPLEQSSGTRADTKSTTATSSSGCLPIHSSCLSSAPDKDARKERHVFMQTREKTCADIPGCGPGTCCGCGPPPPVSSLQDLGVGRECAHRQHKAEISMVTRAISCSPLTSPRIRVKTELTSRQDSRQPL